ncbi:4-hydroxyphenylacetate 3-hydroxylase [Candidatus Bathyarchaeota archaeon]|nr:4-hydroxyphenylacetate 3-hydroxylase [Candidatus Bathyarchaeota archaeon]
MKMKTPEEYKESLREMRPNIHKFGELITDVTTHPATKRCVEGHARIYEAAQNPDYENIVTTTSHLTGEKISRYLSLIESAEEMTANLRLKRTMFHLTGTCTGGRCVGWTSLNAMWATAHDMDKDLGTHYHERLKKWLTKAQAEDIAVAGAMTDPKGNRTLSPSQQEDPDMYLHVVEENADSIKVRGAKIMIAGVAAANEIFVLPGTGYKEADKNYAVAFTIPRDAEGLTIVEATHPSDRRELEEGFDSPPKTGITQAYLFFNDVTVPKERVFMCGEHRYSLNVVLNFIMAYRSAIGACVAGQGDLMLGAATLAARANGLTEKTFRERLTKIAINNETTFGMGIAAATLGKKHPSGVWICDPLLSNINKIYVAALPYEAKVIAQDICGGIGETGCMPSSKDFYNEKYGKLVQKYLKAAAPAEERARIARLIEWLTIGAGVPGCLHGGGSPGGAKIVIWRQIDLDKFTSLARKLAGIKEQAPVAEK